MTLLQQAFNKTQAQRRKPEERGLQCLFIGTMSWKTVGADYYETDSDSAGRGGSH